MIFTNWTHHLFVFIIQIRQESLAVTHCLVVGQVRKPLSQQPQLKQEAMHNKMEGQLNLTMHNVCNQPSDLRVGWYVNQVGSAFGSKSCWVGNK